MNTGDKMLIKASPMDRVLGTKHKTCAGFMSQEVRNHVAPQQRGQGYSDGYGHEQ